MGEKTKKMQILFFCLIPVGIILFIFSIRLVKKTFSGDIILEIPYSSKSAELILTRSGTYSIWHKGQFFRKAPLDEYKPEIISQSTARQVALKSFLLRPNKNNGKDASMELYRFHAEAGRYMLVLAEGSSVSGVERSIINLIPAEKVDPDQYFIQVKESQPILIVLLGILLIALSGVCIIGGLVIGILADQIFKN